MGFGFQAPCGKMVRAGQGCPGLGVEQNMTGYEANNFIGTFMGLISLNGIYQAI